MKQSILLIKDSDEKKVDKNQQCDENKQKDYKLFQNSIELININK